MSAYNQQLFLRPEDSSNIMYWSKKWGVSSREITDAVIDTGSLNIYEIKILLKKRHKYLGIPGKIIAFLKQMISVNTIRYNNKISSYRTDFKLRKIVFENEG